MPSKNTSKPSPSSFVQRVFKKAVGDCRKWGIKIAKVEPVVQFTKAQGIYGATDGKTVILSTRLFLDIKKYKQDPEEVVYNILMHELAHTVKGCFNHGKKWKSVVLKMNEHGCLINPWPYSKNKILWKYYY